MLAVLLFASLVASLPLAVVAFTLGNFAVLTALCVYVTAVSLSLFVTALRGFARGSEFDEA
ncbi:hypothetical protein [Palleronia abyssalis]|uniref:Uncharacterized protein n=1 Tax=Palleronia abyssalis TaxID=1501240 RepID=A0A2R8C1Z3_9RHOB|nr:hypothetical protein [Palleronia abyssalis]SPJ26445.1 hypothetical protein PAA8504_04306 [Palleronia abyssalis]